MSTGRGLGNCEFDVLGEKSRVDLPTTKADLKPGDLGLNPGSAVD